jgi:hypothetical protein
MSTWIHHICNLLTFGGCDLEPVPWNYHIQYYYKFIFFFLLKLMRWLLGMPYPIWLLRLLHLHLAILLICGIQWWFNNNLLHMSLDFASSFLLWSTSFFWILWSMTFYYDCLWYLNLKIFHKFHVSKLNSFWDFCFPYKLMNNKCMHVPWFSLFMCCWI